MAKSVGDAASEEGPAVANDETENFEEFFRAHLVSETAHLVRLGFSQDCALEAVEEAMTTLCARWEDIRHRCAWVRKTSRGHALTITKQRFDVLPDDFERRHPAFQHYDEDPVLQEESKAWIAQLLAGLPLKRREVISAWLEGIPDAEIARDLGISEATVRSHRRHGLADIAERLRREGGLS